MPRHTRNTKRSRSRNEISSVTILFAAVALLLEDEELPPAPFPTLASASAAVFAAAPPLRASRHTSQSPANACAAATSQSNFLAPQPKAGAPILKCFTCPDSLSLLV
eukprot:CAMPEP_0179004622 /NCGR_PEP_ID=MMETSP0795-20121207/13413_1 /TAXON_ID=88552 /ORGANISM="Amoebophrya sp., Strain Ameob2" /LENGTH=106 /DNA_ID=CAMNT_0020698917 /DNA_START=435 /DNA_END=753 /DNA_ORIENTATION=+